MSPKHTHIPPTKEQIETWLFDELMQKIEPALISAKREETAQMLSNLSPEELRVKMDGYQKAIEECARRMPAFIAEKKKEMDSLEKNMRSHIAGKDATAMQDIETKISSSPKV